MQPQDLLPCLKKPTSGSYPAPDDYNPQTYTLFP